MQLSAASVIKRFVFTRTRNEIVPAYGVFTLIDPSSSPSGDGDSVRAFNMHWVFTAASTLAGVIAGFGAMKLVPKAVSLFSSSPGIVAAVIWPVLAVFALAGAAQRAIGSRSRAVFFTLGYLFISMSAAFLTLAIASPWSGISMTGQHLSGTPRELR